MGIWDGVQNVILLHTFCMEISLEFLYDITLKLLFNCGSVDAWGGWLVCNHTVSRTINELNLDL